MMEKEKVFDEAVARGRNGKATELSSWLEENGLETQASSGLDELFRNSPELSQNLNNELITLGEYIGNLEASGQPSHLAVIGVDQVGKTQLCLLLKELLADRSQNFQFLMANAKEFQMIDEENRLRELLKTVEEDRQTVICIDDAWKDKKISLSLGKIREKLANSLVVTTWTPEGWSKVEGKVDQEFPVDNKIHVTPLSQTETLELIESAMDEVTTDGSYVVEKQFSEIIYGGSQGIPGLTIQILMESVNQAFLNEVQLFSEKSAELSIKKMNLTGFQETIKSLSQIKKQIAGKALRERDERGIRPKKISESFQKSKSTVSYHLRDMESKKILERNQVGRSTFYKIRDEFKPLIQLQLQGESEFYD
jgi:DNA-binding transcriptional ArsR family regulator